MIIKPDVEAYFEFNRRRNVKDGYRPAHLIKDNYLTTGLHKYLKEQSVDGKLIGTITFITPEEYPACLWIGKKIEMYEGSKLIGYATITKIYNLLLEKHEKCTDIN